MPDNQSTVRLVDNQTPQSVRIDDSIIAGLEIRLDAQLGSAAMSVARLMQLKAGDCVALDAALNRDVELKLNGLPVAAGELVTVGPSFGVRITSVAQK